MKRIILVLVLSLTMHYAWSQTSDSILAKKTDTTAIVDYDKVFTVVQVEAAFPGGKAGWAKYLEKHLDRDVASKYLEIPKGEKRVTQAVIVSFIVDKEGNVSDVIADNAESVYPKLAEEAIRVIKKGPRWVPAMQNGHKVASRVKQPIIWGISEE